MPADSPGDPDRYFTVAELSARKGVPKSLIYKLVADGRIPYLRVRPRGKLRLPEDAFEQAITLPAVRAGASSAGPTASPPAPPARTAAAKTTRKRLSGRRPRWQQGGGT